MQNMSNRSAIQQAKKAFRKEMMEKLSSVPPHIIQQDSEKVLQKLIQHPIYLKSRSVSIFLNRIGEVETLPIVKHIFESGKKCYVPRCAPDEMDMVKMDSFEDVYNLPKNKWNIPEPLPDIPLESIFDSKELLDLVIMPGLAFDSNNHRIGYGKGYYDTFLRRLRDHAKERQHPVPKTIAIGISIQRVASIPFQDDWDELPDEVLIPPFHPLNGSA